MTVSPNRSRPDGFKSYHAQVEFRTISRFQYIDLTDLVAEKVRRSGITHGMVNIQTRHTTTGVMINEKEPLLMQDFRDHLERWAPQHSVYLHNDLTRREEIPPDERPNADSHLRAMLLRTSETVNIVDGELQLGHWQSIFLVEMDGSRMRSVSINILGLVSGDEPVREPLRAAVGVAV